MFLRTNYFNEQFGFVTQLYNYTNAGLKLVYPELVSGLSVLSGGLGALDII